MKKLHTVFHVAFCGLIIFTVAMAPATLIIILGSRSWEAAGAEIYFIAKFMLGSFAVVGVFFGVCQFVLFPLMDRYKWFMNLMGAVIQVVQCLLGFLVLYFLMHRHH